ncbi:MAG: paraquat-inducible protein A [Halioglobus sp.]|nr:paraquat-inducible protein A [Halioglobus sp.]
MSAEMACPACDLLLSIGTLEHGEHAECPRCGCFLTRYRRDASERVLAFASSALVLLLLANADSFLALSASGLESEIRLWQTPAALWDNDMPLVALMVTAFIIAIPAALLTLIVLLTLALQRGRYRPWLVTTAHAVFLARNWAMVEVFIIGVIVSLVKIASMATVIPGLSFWAYAAFTVCFTLTISNLDRYQCWENIEALARQ